MSRIDVMLDLETLGVGVNPAIIQISAVPFNIETGETNGDHFNQFINPISARTVGEINGSTLEFWFKQSREVINKVIMTAFDDGGDVESVFSDFSDWIGDLYDTYDEIYFWGNGIMSDNVWLESLSERLGKKSPIKFYEHRDVRTIVDLCRMITGKDPKNEIEFIGTKHDAIDDCKHQIKYVSECYRLLKGDKTKDEIIRPPLDAIDGKLSEVGIYPPKYQHDINEGCGFPIDHTEVVSPKK